MVEDVLVHHYIIKLNAIVLAVLILVVVEDVLVLVTHANDIKMPLVLILVVVEDVLVRLLK